MRLATIDIGTNTAQLLVVEVSGDTLERVHAAERFVRLGEGVDANDRISPAARKRLRNTLQEHVQAAKDHGTDELVAAGTSALRDAANRREIVEELRDTLGLDIEILSGEAEAAWSFAAACAPFDDLRGPCLVVDIGGGSTELIAGTNPAEKHPRTVDAITDRTSLDVGCVRLTERCFSSQPPPEQDVVDATDVIDSALAESTLRSGPAPILIGTAGTATALALVHAGPGSTWDALHGDGFELSRRDVRNWRDHLLQSSIDEIYSLHPDAMDGRADVFSVGVLLLDRIMEHFSQILVRVSPYELRHGLALRWLARSR